MKEIWKTVVTPDGIYKNYMVSSLGRIKSLNYHGGRKEKILRPYNDGYGYLKIDIRENGVRKTYRIHRLVAYAFIPNIDQLPEINHRDEDKHNNVVTNLEWCTREYNINYGSRTKRASKARKGKYCGKNSPNYGKHHSEETKKKMSKRVICLETGKIFYSETEASKQLEINRGNIASVCRGERKTAGKLTFRFLEEE